MLSQKEKENIWFLHRTKQMPKVKIAEKLGYSRNTVISVLKEQPPEIEQLVSVVKGIEQEHNEKIIDIIKNDNRLPDIINKILNEINSDVLIEQYAKNNGLKSLMTVIGVLSDKNISVKRLDLDQRRVEALERQVELKERELDMRITTPEAFSGVTIINDADATSEYIKEYKTLMEKDVKHTN